MHNSVVAMFCGPHEDGRPTSRRINAAIQTAMGLKAPLMIAGDANDGKDLELFAGRAHRRSPALDVVKLYDERANTLADVQILIEELREHRHRGVTTIYLVTDWWHMPRSFVMLALELQNLMPERRFDIQIVNVRCPEPPHEELLGERQGIMHYLAGTYGSHELTRKPYGKPAQERALAAPVAAN